jgi:hypothetical protein
VAQGECDLSVGTVSRETELFLGSISIFDTHNWTVGLVEVLYLLSSLWLSVESRSGVDAASR